MRKTIISTALIFLGLLIVVAMVAQRDDVLLIDIGHPHGEIWNYTAFGSPFRFEIVEANAYHNFTNLNQERHLREITVTQAAQEDGGSYFTVQVPGLYRLAMSISMQGVLSNNVFSFAIVKNFNISESRGCYTRRLISANQIGNAAVNCIEGLEVGDTINIQIENEDGNRDIDVHTANLNVMWIDNIP